MRNGRPLKAIKEMSSYNPLLRGGRSVMARQGRMHG